MADATELQSSGSTKIAGANPGTGTEDNFMEVNADGSINSRGVEPHSAFPDLLIDGVSDFDTADPYGNGVKIAEVSAFTRWGKAFRTTTNVITIVAVSETPIFLLTNPNASGKNIRIVRIVLLGATGSNNNATYRFYIDPTVTANGTSLTINGARQTGQSTTVATVFSSPTVTSNGTVLEVHRDSNSSETLIDFEFGMWIEPNHKFLVTILNTATNLTSAVSLVWVEE